ncbi:MAG TPA: transglutaminase domain-containing protein [Anaerolineae bacterium]|nr:transglutaminase domain-containing protein [Anaerolineae bacterium]
MMIKFVLSAVVVMVIGVPLYALPATLSLPRGVRSGLDSLTVSRAAVLLRESGESGMKLVEAARSLVAERMAYSRRNSFDSYAKAFERGYGYCSQQANALVSLLTRLGFEAKVVHALRNRFPDGTVTSHAWVQVAVDDEVRYVDSIFYDADAAEINFKPLSEVREVPPVLRFLEIWGAPAVNAHRYYLTGKDQDW